MKKVEKLVPDTSVIIEAVLSQQLTSKKAAPKAIVFHEAVLAELEHQANQGRAIGFLGLDEIERIRELASKHKRTEGAIRSRLVRLGIA